jgi:glucokinase
MSSLIDPAQSNYAIGVDVGGTKIAAGLVRLADGKVLARRHTSTSPERGGRRVLEEVIDIIRSLADEGASLRAKPSCAGIGLAELVSPRGEVLSAATIDWLQLDPLESAASATGLSVFLEADVRAAALAEARYGAGWGKGSFLFVTIGTGISASLVIDGAPYTGAHGLTGTFASSPSLTALSGGNLIDGPPLEQHASGPALQKRFRETQADFTGTARDVLALAERDDQEARWIVETAGGALGAAIAQLVNTLDPELVVLGGGLGTVEGLYRRALESTMRKRIWSDVHRDVPLLATQLGVDAGLVGAAASCLLRRGPIA